MFQFDSYLQFAAQFAFYIGLSGALISLLILIVHSYRLSNVLDPHTFNSTYFNDYELNIYGSFPLNVIKTIVYQAGIVFPNIMKRRFKDIDIRDKVNTFDIFISYISVFLIILSPLSFIHLVVVFFISS